MWDRVNIPLGIENSVRNIFGAVLLGGIDRSNPANAELIKNEKSKEERFDILNCIADYQPGVLNKNDKLKKITE